MSRVDRYQLPEYIKEDLVEADKYSKNMKDYVLIKKYNRSITKHEKRINEEHEYII
jgi:hypothetical protein